jgi:putative SOS response-associated peptidase YedK
MCGRYASARKRQELLEEFRIDRDRVTDELGPDYNVAPTKPVYAVLTRGERGPGEGRGARPGAGGAEPEGVARELRVVRWGLVPFWAKDPSIGNRLINARVETVDAKPAFRTAFGKRRCLLPADGFYEWLHVTGQGKARKQPYYIHRADGAGLAFAGLYELWRDKSYPDDHPRAWLWTAVIITTQAEDEAGRLHDRMPMIVDPGSWQDWLDPGGARGADLHALLAPAASARLVSYPVSTDVNYVRNNGPALIEPLAADPAGGAGAGGLWEDGPRSGPSGGRPARPASAGRAARTRGRYRDPVPPRSH